MNKTGPWPGFYMGFYTHKKTWDNMTFIITLEGIDGSGKSTLLKKVQENFIKNENIIFIHSPIMPFQDIRRSLEYDNYDNFLFYQASNSFLSKKIHNTNKLYIIDRFSYSTYTVHSSNGNNKNHIEDSFRFLNLIIPQMMFLVKADYDICIARISKRKILSNADKWDAKSFKELYNMTYNPNNVKIKTLLFQNIKIITNNDNIELKENVNRVSSYIDLTLKKWF